MRNQAHKFAPHFQAMASDHLYEPFNDLGNKLDEVSNEHNIKESKLYPQEGRVEITFIDGSIMNSRVTITSST